MLPERLRQLRKSRNLTLPNLAKELNKASKGMEGVSKNTASQLGNWERGERKPDYNELIKLADFFDVQVDYLIGRSRENDIDLLQVFLQDNLFFNERQLTGVDKFAIMKLIQSYFNGSDNRITNYFDEQTGLDLYGDK